MAATSHCRMPGTHIFKDPFITRHKAKKREIYELNFLTLTFALLSLKCDNRHSVFTL